MTWDSAMSARSSASSSSCWIFPALGQMNVGLLQFLELLLATLHGQVLSLIQAVLQVLNSDLQVLLHPLQVSVTLHLLLDSQGIVPAPDLRIQSALHGVNHPLALPVHLTLNLVELQLDTQNL
uniref:Uncharacterized protein n=1 Tax=Lates calcarifer TaxID=8187 RepID=A0A4W6DSF5_LATCA